MIASDLVFARRNEDHSVTLARPDGDELTFPSVTTVLKILWDGWTAEPFYLERGRAVHAACEYHEKGILDEESIHPEVAPYFSAYLRFLEESKWVSEKIEPCVWSLLYGFAGQPDRIGYFKRPHPTMPIVKAILDIKCGDLHISYGPQTAGYVSAWYELHGEPIGERYILQLMNTGNYKLHRLKEKTDKSLFFSCLTIWNARRKWNNGYR